MQTNPLNTSKTSAPSKKPHTRIISKCPSCGRKPRRSTQANRRYWELITLISEGVKTDAGFYSQKTWHLYFKLRYLGGDDEALPSGEQITVPKSSSDLDTAEFSEYMEKVEQFAALREIWLMDEAA